MAVSGSLPGASGVRSRTKLRDLTAVVVEAARSIRIVERVEREAGMPVEDSADRPAAHNPLLPVVAMEESWLPETEELKGVGNVRVRTTVGVVHVIRIRIFFVRTGVFVHGLSPGVLSFDVETVR